MPEEVLTPDLCVIGGSAGAASLAAAAAVLGVGVVLVESASGGSSRTAHLKMHALRAVARRVHAMRQAADVGIAPAEPEIDFARVRTQAAELVADLGRNVSAARLAALGVHVIRGDARFIDAGSVMSGSQEIRARRFVLALSPAPVIPAIRALSRTPYLTPDTVLDLRECPRQLLVVGAGSSGLAVAQVFRRLGAEVTVLEATAPLHDEDPECAAIVIDALAREGVKILSPVEIERAEGKRGSVRLSLAGGTEPVEGTRLLLAVGRKIPTDGLGLELAGIATDANGMRVGRNFRTSNANVYALDERTLHGARWHSRLILRHILFRLPVRTGTAAIPRVTATDPELAHVGLREDEARASHGRIRILRSPFGENDRAVIEREGEGMIKLVTTQHGRLVGATIVGAGAGELIGTYALMVARRLNVRDLADPLFPEPSRSEIGHQAALGDVARGLTSPWVQRIMSLARFFR